MGQRTQILVVRENKLGEKKARFYHHQWGYGRNMYHAIMDAFLNDYSKETFDQNYNFLDYNNFTTFGRKLHDETPMTMDDVEKELKKHDYTKDFKDEIRKTIKDKGSYYNRQLNLNFDTWPALTKALEEVDLNNFDTIKNVFAYGDNNNGGLVIHIKEHPEHSFYGAEFKIGFLLGDEDATPTEKAFERYLTPTEYAKMNGGSEYSDEKFIEMFNAFCEYYGIGFIDDKDEEVKSNVF